MAIQDVQILKPLPDVCESSQNLTPPPTEISNFSSKQALKYWISILDYFSKFQGVNTGKK